MSAEQNQNAEQSEATPTPEHDWNSEFENPERLPPIKPAYDILKPLPPKEKTQKEQEDLDAEELEAAVEQKGRKKPKEDTIEYYWAKHVAKLDWGIFYEDGKVAIPYQYNGKVWSPMTPEDIESEAEKFVYRFASSYTDGKKRSCIGLASAILRRCKKILTLDKERALMSVRGGILEVLVDGSVRLLSHTPALFVRNFIDVDINRSMCDKDGFYTPRDQVAIEQEKGLLSSLITSSFAAVDIRRAFQESLGDTLLPENSQVTPFLIGDGGQGKSQWLTAMRGLHTFNAVADLANLSGFALSNFIGCSLLVVDEVKHRMDEQAFKRIFGGGVGVQVDRKYATPISWEPDIKGIVAVNVMPTFSEHSEAILRRICPFPMTKAMHTSVDRVKDIGKKILNGYKVRGARKGEEVRIPDQRRDFFDWILSGAIRVMIRGRLLNDDELPLACRLEKNTLRVETDPVWAFVKELEWEPTDKGGVSKEEIYSVYGAWCLANGRKGVLGSHKFGRDLKRQIERENGPGTCKEGKITIKTKNLETVWKNAYRLRAKNGGDWGVKYQAYTDAESEESVKNSLDPKINTGSPIIEDFKGF